MTTRRSILAQVAEAVKDDLAGATFTLGFEPRRTFDTELRLEDAGTLHVDVFVGPASLELETRDSERLGPAVEIAIRKRFTEDECETDGSLKAEEVDRLLLLYEEIGRYILGRDLVAYASASCTEIELVYPWVPRHLREWRQYTGVLRCTFSVSEDLEV